MRINNPVTPMRLYRHWKTGDLYFVLAVTEDASNNNKRGTNLSVTYIATYAPFKTYTRPLSEFIEKVPVDRFKENGTGQVYRFELFDCKKDKEEKGIKSVSPGRLGGRPSVMDINDQASEDFFNQFDNNEDDEDYEEELPITGRYYR